jgi:hypothetical protein
MNKQQIEKEVFCNGTWSHKYNEARNERLANDIGEPNDRTGADCGMEREVLTNNQ